MTALSPRHTGTPRGNQIRNEGLSKPTEELSGTKDDEARRYQLGRLAQRFLYENKEYGQGLTGDLPDKVMNLLSVRKDAEITNPENIARVAEELRSPDAEKLGRFLRWLITENEDSLTGRQNHIIRRLVGKNSTENNSLTELLKRLDPGPITAARYLSRRLSGNIPTVQE